MSEDFNSEELRYALRDSGFADQLAEAARAFNFAGIGGEVSAPVLELVAENNLISEKDIDALINEIVARAGGDRADPNMQNFIAEAVQSIGGSRAGLEGLRNMGLAMLAQTNINRQDANSPETREQALQRLAAEIEAIDRSQRERVEEMYRSGYLTKDERDAWMATYEPNPYPQGTAEWQAEEDRRANVRTGILDDARDRLPPGQQEPATAVDARGAEDTRADKVRETRAAYKGQEEGVAQRAETSTFEHTPVAAAVPVPAGEPEDLFAAAAAGAAPAMAATEASVVPAAPVPAPAVVNALLPEIPQTLAEQAAAAVASMQPIAPLQEAGGTPTTPGTQIASVRPAATGAYVS